MRIFKLGYRHHTQDDSGIAIEHLVFISLFHYLFNSAIIFCHRIVQIVDNKGLNKINFFNLNMGAFGQEFSTYCLYCSGYMPGIISRKDNCW